MKIKRKLTRLRRCGVALIGVIALFAARPAAAQNAPVVRSVLPNGVRLLLRPEPAAETVAITVCVRMEAASTPQEAAVGELVARGLFYGNVNRTEFGIQALANEAGGSFDILHTRGYVAINCVTTPPRLAEALHLLADCLANADFTAASLQRARRACAEQQRGARESGLTEGYAALCEAFGGPAPDEAHLQRVTPEEARRYFLTHYLPERTVFSLAGRFQTEQARSACAAFLAPYDRRPARWPLYAPESPAEPTERRIERARPGKAAYALIGVAAPGPGPDYAAFTVLETLLGGGHACRLFREAREQAGVGYAVGAACQADTGGPLALYLEWNPQRGGDAKPLAPADVLKLLEQQFDAILTRPPTEAELNRARNFAIGRDALRHERLRDRAFLPAWYETLGLGYTYDAAFPEQLARVTREDIARLARPYLTVRVRALLLPAPQ